MQLTNIIKCALVGCALFAAGAAAYDLCQQPETRSLCSGNWGIPRLNMPQIVDEVRENFLKTLPSSQYGKHTVDSALLVPVQCEINGIKVGSMVSEPV